MKRSDEFNTALLIQGTHTSAKCVSDPFNSTSKPKSKIKIESQSSPKRLPFEKCFVNFKNILCLLVCSMVSNTLV